MHCHSVHCASFPRNYPVIPGQSGYVIPCVIVIVLGLFSLAAKGQSQPAPKSATVRSIVQGHVADAQGHSISMVRVEVKAENEDGNLSMQTDSAGNYRFTSMAAGRYLVRAELTGYQSTNSGPFMLRSGEDRRIDLTLQPQQHASLGAPEFFDQPQFTIAGVTDTTNLGGHASGMAPPAESLTKDIASLSKGTSAPSSNGVPERTVRDRAKRLPKDFEANYRAGKLLLHDGKSQEAVPYLERASWLKPDDYDSQYALAQAFAAAGEYGEARTLIQSRVRAHDNASWHHLLAEVEEKSGNPLEAVNEYQQAAKLDSSETNLFDWGVELLTHRAVEPAIEVFSNGNRRFPGSARMLTGLAVASYDRGLYEDALRMVCAAADLNPPDPSPYLLLGKMQNGDNGHSDEPLTRLERFAHLQPENPSANYYYALALWKRRKGPEDARTAAQVESLLQKSVRLDPKLAKGYFQLGVLYSERQDLAQAISAYETAVQIDPQLEEGHYRLAQAYRASGQIWKGQKEIERYKATSKTRAEEMERERREIRQFVYSMQKRSAAGKPQ
jgi:tetratricopeptide (TPR) repeat protein